MDRNCRRPRRRSGRRSSTSRSSRVRAYTCSKALPTVPPSPTQCFNRLGAFDDWRLMNKEWEVGEWDTEKRYYLCVVARPTASQPKKRPLPFQPRAAFADTAQEVVPDPLLRDS